MATFRYDTRVAGAPDEVFAVLSSADHVPEWFPGIVRVEFDGQHRFVHLANGHTLTARVVTSDPQLRRFQYQFLAGMAVPIDFHLGTIDVLPDRDGSLVIYSQQIEPDELGGDVGPAVAGGIEGIRRYFERSGE